MRKIELTQEKEALIDDDMFDQQVQKAKPISNKQTYYFAAFKFKHDCFVSTTELYKELEDLKRYINDEDYLIENVQLFEIEYEKMP